MARRTVSVNDRTAPASGRTVGGPAIPDSEDLQARYDWTQASVTSTVEDQTGNGHDLTGSYTGPTATINGLQAGEFDGADDFVDVDWPNQSQPNHIFVVFQYLSDPNSTSGVIGGANDGQHKIGNNNNGDLDLYAGNANGVVDGDADTNPHIASGLFDGGSSVLRIDGTQVATGDVGGQDMGGLTAGAQAGGNNYANVAIGEILPYQTDKSSNQSDIETYLANKWGITL